VVGAGCFGAWAALLLRESGRSVALIDAFGSGNSRSSSGGTSRIIRMGYGADEIYTRWSMQSLPVWKNLFERVQQPELFQRTGVLWTSREGHPHAQGMLAVFDRLNVTYKPLSSDDLRKRYPQFRFDGELQGILEPESGALLASRAVRTVAQEAARLGADPITTRVLPPPEANRLEWIITEDRSRIAAKDFVFACGPWLPKLFPRLLGERSM
jgi:sarcosine oxidase